MKDFDEIVKLIERLRGKNGCPWDRAQTIESLKNDLMSEAEEVEKAIKAKDYENLKEELGDLLWAIVLISQVAKEEGLFNINDVLKIAKEKIIRRHPHVFGNLKAKTVKEAIEIFQEVKRKEKLKK
jgi:uncharacterized protein YabN with tetrapyrrole methylase and pyrophosphatase domain